MRREPMTHEQDDDDDKQDDHAQDDQQDEDAALMAQSKSPFYEGMSYVGADATPF